MQEFCSGPEVWSADEADIGPNGVGLHVVQLDDAPGSGSGGGGVE